MTEPIFTIFDGPNKGKSLTLGDKSLWFGRDSACDVVLSDDRTSRVHARLVRDGEDVMIVDENSSNGTFVNGKLVDQCRLNPGDIIAIGENKMIYGREAPSAERLQALGIAGPRRAALQPAADVPTKVLHQTAAASAPPDSQAHPTHVMEAVAEAARPIAAPRGIHVAVEAEIAGIPTHVVNMDQQKLYSVLATLLSSFLNILQSGRGTVAMRLGPDPAQRGARIEIICAGLPIPRPQVTALVTEGVFADIQRTVQENGGVLEILPADAHDTLARLCLPRNPPEDMRPTIIEQSR